MTIASRPAWRALLVLAVAPAPAWASQESAFAQVLGDFAVVLRAEAEAEADAAAAGERARAAARWAAKAAVAANGARWRREAAYFLSKAHDYPALAALLDRPYRPGRAELITAEGLRFSSRSPRAAVPAVQDRFATAYAIAVGRRASGRPSLSAALDRGGPVDFVAAEFDLDRARLDAEIAAARAAWHRAPDRAFLLALFGGLARRDPRYLRDAVTLAFAQYEERLAAGEPPRRAEVILSEQVRWLMNALPDRELALLRTAVAPQLAAVHGDYAAEVRRALEALLEPPASASRSRHASVP